MRPMAVAPLAADIRLVAAMNPPAVEFVPMEDCAHSGRAVTGGGRVSPEAAKR
jgi:hypothetical protein